MAKKKSGSNEATLQSIQSIYDARESALSTLKQSAVDLDRLLQDGVVKVGDRFTVNDRKMATGSKEMAIVDNFAASNFIWRPLLVERFKLDEV